MPALSPPILSPAAPHPLRRDAVRNRDRILQVAGDVFAVQGLDASMSDIAAAAGVGVGTVYRRFPRRDDLILGVFDRRLAAIEALTAEAAGHADAWEAIVWIFEQVLALEAADRGLMQLLENDAVRTSIGNRKDGIRAGLCRLIRRAQESGQLRPDVDVGDFLLLRRMLTDAAVATSPARPDLWRRTLAVCLDGLRAPGTTPLPGPPLSAREVEQAVEASSSRTTGHSAPPPAPARRPTGP